MHAPTSPTTRTRSLPALLVSASLLLLPAPLFAAGERIQVYRTNSDLSSALSQQADLSFAPDQGGAQVSVRIDPSIRYQQMDGFGVSLTDSSCWLIQTKLSPAKKSAVMAALFGPEGIGMSMLRQPIGACDFNREMYSYSNTAGDTALRDFSIAKDEEVMIPTIKEALALNPAIKIMASPWSPPAWMKSTGSMIGGSLKAANYPTMADYFVKYVKAYAEHGIPIYAVTPQNEPGYSPSKYPGCLYSGLEQITFIRDNLAPAFKAASIDTKILCYDHNYDAWNIPTQILANQATRDVVAGSAFHHYGGDPSMMSSLHALYPNKDIWFTEGGIGDWNNTFDNVAHEMIAIPRNWAKSIIFWNAALDPEDGPSLIGANNTNQGMITIRSDVQDKVTYNAQYYYMGHLSKFVKPGAWRVDSPSWEGSLETVAFHNNDGSIAVVVFNKQTTQASIKLLWGTQSALAVLPAKSLTTFHWNTVVSTQTLKAGDSLSLSATSNGNSAPSFQWQHNGTPITGASAATLVLKSLSSLDAGAYTCVLNPAATIQDRSEFRVSVTPTLDSNPSARLVNISTRSQVGTGESLQAAGFVIGGDKPKQVLIRAAGPALAAFLSGYLPNPSLRLNDLNRGGIVAENDDWDYDNIFSTAHALQAFDWTKGSRDAALLATLRPGLYSAEVVDKTGASGINLIEVYENDENSRCVNISTRSIIGPGFDNQVAGFVIKGSGLKTVLIRAAGPALKQWITNTVANPVLEIYNSKSEKVFENDDWDYATIHPTAHRLQAFDWPQGSRDAALLVSLPEGLYTAAVRDKTGGTGVGLIEVYEVNQ